MTLLLKAVRGLLSSKKAMMAFISAVLWAVGKTGFGLESAELLPVVVPLWAYIAAQAGADWGKGDGAKEPSIMDAVRGLLGSRKAMMAFIAALVWGFGNVGMHWDSDTLLPIVVPLWGYIAAQAGADWGKEKKAQDVEVLSTLMSGSSLPQGLPQGNGIFSNVDGSLG